MVEYKKPLPIPNADTKEYWEGARRHELLVQRCKYCGTYRFYPASMCHKCNSENTEWIKVSGKGTVYTWTVIWRAVHPGWEEDELPYTVVVVELDEQPGLLIPGNLLECDPKDIECGMPVEVTFVDVTGEVTLPQWRSASR